MALSRVLTRRVTPGSEVKERLLPQETLWGSFDLTDNWMVEAYYVWNWRPSIFISPGTLFSPFDYIGPGFNPDLSLPGVEYRGHDFADRGGQWGLATRFVIESMNSAELGLYWVRSHAFIPHLQADFDPTGVGPLSPVSNLQLGPVSYRSVFPEDQNTYSVLLPVGRYYAYAWAPGYNLEGAYTNSNSNGLMITFSVESGLTTPFINLCDWSPTPHGRGQ